MYAAGAVHRLNQYSTASMDVSKYDTLRGYRDAANYRTSMKQTLRLISTKVIEMSREQNDSTIEEAVTLPSPTGAFELSQVEEVDEDEYDSDGSAIEDENENTPDPKAMPFSAAQTGKSPNAQGKSLKCIDAVIEKRCDMCLGIFLTKIVNDPDGKSANKKVRRQCVLCKRRCNTWCTGCRTVLCISPPQGGKVRVKKTFTQRRTVRVKKSNRNKKRKKTITFTKYVWKKVPSKFYVDVPQLDETGKIKKNSKGPIYTREYGELTCYHIKHANPWRRHLLNAQADMIAQVAEAKEKAEKAAKGKRKRKRKKAKNNKK